MNLYRGSSLERTVCDRARLGSLGTDDALRLFDELLQQPRPRLGSARAFNHLLSAVARGRDGGSARAASLFCRVVLALSPLSAARAGWTSRCPPPPLAAAPKSGVTLEAISFTLLLRALCGERRVTEAVDVARRMMPDLEWCRTPPSSTASSKKVRWRMPSSCSTKCVTRSVTPNVVTNCSIIDKLCKVGAVDKAEGGLRRMVDEGAAPSCSVYSSLINGCATSGQWKKTVMMFKEMSGKGMKPTVITYTSLMGALCKHRKCSEAKKIFDYMVKSGEKPDVTAYNILLHGNSQEGRTWCLA